MFSADFHQVRLVWGANITEGRVLLTEWWHSSYTVPHVYECICMCLHVCMYVCGGRYLCSCMWRLRSVPDIFLSFFLHCFWDKVSSLKLELANSASLAEQQAPRILLVLPSPVLRL